MMLNKRANELVERRLSDIGDLRGTLALVDAMALGMKAMSFSAKVQAEEMNAGKEGMGKRGNETNDERRTHKMNELDHLVLIDPKMVPKVPFQNEIKHARIEEIYDGDTVKIIVLFGDVPVRFSLRILGIDTPEIKQGEGRLPEERQAAIKVRDYLRSLFPKNIAKICIRDWDKYGGKRKHRTRKHRK